VRISSLGWRKFSGLQQLGSDLPRQAHGGSRSGPRTYRGAKCLQTASATLATADADFKLKMRKPREQLDGNRYWNRSTGGLVAIAVREGFARFCTPVHRGKKRRQRRFVLPVFPVHSFCLRPTLRLRSCISAFASRKSAVSKPSVNWS
jgi:hypothetical protein